MDLKKIFESPIKKKIIKLFHENPSTVDTSRGIAAWIGYDRKEVKRVLEELVELKILVAHRALSTTGYAYTQDKNIISKIDKFLTAKGSNL